MSASRPRLGLASAGTVRAGLLGGVATSSGMALTATSGWLIVRAAEQPVILTLLTAIVAVRAFGMARPVFRYWERLVSHDASLAALADRRTAAYAALIPLTPARLGRRRRSDVLTGVVDDLTDVVEAQVRVTVPVVSTAVAGGLVIALTSAVAPPVGLVLLCLGVVVGLVCVLAARLESRSLTALLAARADVAQVAELTTGSAHELQAVGGWGTALGWLDDAHRRLDRATRRASTGRALASALFLLAVGAAVVVVARLVVDLDVTAPVKALLLLTPVAVSEAITPLVDAMRSLARARAAADRVDALLGLEPAVRDATRATPRDHRGHATGAPDIRLEAVTASWTGARTDAGPVDLHVAPGTHLALMGPNGAGKSTLLALLARHLDPSGGRCTWDGADVTAVPADAVRSRVAVVDDEPHVFATTLRHNLRLAAPDATDADLLEALDRAGLGRLLAGLPDGLDTRLGAGGRGVSGGERARLGVARALASTRPVILLDEPVAHLDPPTARSVVADLLGTDHHDISRTIVMVTHRDEGLDRFDRVIRIDAAHR